MVLPRPAVEGLRITDDREAPHELDVRMIATGHGYSGLTGVDVTYRAGFLRQRTARLHVRVCLRASGDWTADRVDFDPGCVQRR